MLGKIENIRVDRQLALSLELPHHPPLWRPVHYLGSKLRLINSIREILDDLDPTSGTVCDLFAGSGTVSMGLSSTRNVIAADIQEYSRVLCKALLRPASLNSSTVENLLQAAESSRKRLEGCLEPILEFEQHAMDCASTNPALLCNLVERGSLFSADEAGDALSIALRETSARVERHVHALMATRYFGGIYFSYRQTLYIDCMLAAIAELPQTLRDTCLAALLSTASTIVNSIGKQFAQPMRPRRRDRTIKQHLINQMCRDRSHDASEVFADWLSRYRALPKGGAHQVIRGDYREVLPQLREISVIYADPPYTRDHYSRFYHVLETLCLGDFPTLSTTLLTGEGATSRGLYRTDRHQSPFCIKSQAPGAFAELFAGVRNLDVPLLLSYSPFIKEGHPRLMTIEAVANLAAEYYGKIAIVPAGDVAHSKLNRSGLHLDVSDDAEIFIVCRP